MLEDIFNIREKIVIITGGLGQLGMQYTHALLECGARVACFDVDISGVSRLTEHVGKDALPNLRVVQCDITDRASIDDALARVVDDWGPPHALVNNAALDSPPNAPREETGPFESYPESLLDDVMDVNVKGVFLCCQVIGGLFAREGRGSIVNISSIYGVVAPDQRIYEYRRSDGEVFFKPVAYSVSKSALLNLTRYLAVYWAEHNVRVNTLTLGGVFNDQDERFLKGYCARVPLGRMANQDEYNGAILFLISDASSYMTGANLVIDGGWTAW